MAKEVKGEEKEAGSDLVINGWPVGRIVRLVGQIGGIGGCFLTIIIIGVLGLNKFDALRKSMEAKVDHVNKTMGEKVDKVSGSIAGVKQEMTVIRTTLDLVSPADPHKEVQGLRRDMITKEDLRKNAPWKLVEADWLAWRRRMEERVSRLEKK